MIHLKKKVLVLILCVISTQGFSQEALFPVFENQKWGAHDENFTTILETQYDLIKVHHGEYFEVAKDDRFAAYDKKGKQLTPFIYHSLDFSHKSFIITRKENLFGFCTYLGKVIFKPKFKSIKIINSTLIIVSDGSAKRVYNTKSKKFSDEYSNIIYSTDNHYIFTKNGKQFLQNISTGEKTNLYGLIVFQMNSIYTLENQNKTDILDLRNGFNIINDIKNPYFSGVDGIVSYKQKEKLIIENTVESQKASFDADKVERQISFIKKNSYGGMASFIQPQNDNSFWVISKNGKRGVIAKNFKTLIPTKYSLITTLDSTFEVSGSGKKGRFSNTGNVIVPFLYSDYKKFKNYYLVTRNNKKGIVQNGKEIIPTKYDFLGNCGNGNFTFKRGNMNGIVSQEKETVIKGNFGKVIPGTKALIVTKDKKKGLVSFEGETLLSPQFTKIEKLTSNFFRVQQDKKWGVVNGKGKSVIPIVYQSISPTADPQIFKTFGFEANAEGKDKKHRSGYVNSYGDILLDTLYSASAIEADFSTGLIKAKLDTGVLVITIDEKGKLIDKIKYKNYISVKTRVEKSKDNEWKYKQAWGLFTHYGRKIISHRFEQKRDNLFSNPDLVITTYKQNCYSGKENKFSYGIVNQKTGKIILSAFYLFISEDDVQNANVARCYKGSGKITLINTNGTILSQNFGYVGEFESGFARANLGGQTISKKKNAQFSLFSPYISDNIYRSFLRTEKNAYCKGGKWGIIDANGKFIEKPQYDFIQEGFRNEFIASKNGKWGVITPDGKNKVDFKYDELKYFFSTDNKDSWANIPYYRAKISGKFGVIDSTGNLIIPAEFQDIEYLENNGQAYFKTITGNGQEIFGFIDTEANTIIAPKFIKVGDFKNGRAKVKISKRRWNFIDKTGKVISEKEYIDVKDFHEGLAAVKTHKGWGYVDVSGEEVIPVSYKRAGNFNNGIAPVRTRQSYGLLFFKKKSYKEGVISMDNKTIIKVQYDNISDFRNGFAIVRSDNRYGIINQENKAIVKAKYRKIERDEFTESFILISNKRDTIPLNKLALKASKTDSSTQAKINAELKLKQEKTKKANTPIEITLERKISNFSEGKASYGTKHIFGLYDAEGNQLIENKYLSINNFTTDFFIIQDIGKTEYFTKRKPTAELSSTEGK